MRGGGLCKSSGISTVIHKLTRRPAQAKPYCKNVLWALPMTVHYSDLTSVVALKSDTRSHTGEEGLCKNSVISTVIHKMTRRPAQAKPYCKNMLWALPMTVHDSDLTSVVALKSDTRSHTGEEGLCKNSFISTVIHKMTRRPAQAKPCCKNVLWALPMT